MPLEQPRRCRENDVGSDTVGNKQICQNTTMAIARVVTYTKQADYLAALETPPEIVKSADLALHLCAVARLPRGREFIRRDHILVLPAPTEKVR